MNYHLILLDNVWRVFQMPEGPKSEDYEDVHLLENDMETYRDMIQAAIDNAVIVEATDIYLWGIGVENREGAQPLPTGYQVEIIDVMVPLPPTRGFKFEKRARLVKI